MAVGEETMMAVAIDDATAAMRWRAERDGQHGEKPTSDGDDRSVRWQRRRSTTTRQGGLDGKKRASPMGTRGSPAAQDCEDGDDGLSDGTTRGRPRRRRVGELGKEHMATETYDNSDN
ncbi:hypothetical protein E2562_032254 [Oryza meyeriana var. granulata]|uniref:DUF834 domain-containing protein n=1 Tax=Oryza meyeriana var. granulata TaxID=110450 RepID=A0A6G1D9U7_9ORYZ|nr:hypothetical protein E2562_032254 [Oryza meyeriana var. granulata]